MILIFVTNLSNLKFRQNCYKTSERGKERLFTIHCSMHIQTDTFFCFFFMFILCNCVLPGYYVCMKVWDPWN